MTENGTYYSYFLSHRKQQYIETKYPNYISERPSQRRSRMNNSGGSVHDTNNHQQKMQQYRHVYTQPTHANNKTVAQYPNPINALQSRMPMPMPHAYARKASAGLNHKFQINRGTFPVYVLSLQHAQPVTGRNFPLKKYC